jgi:ribosomal protein L31E
MLQITGEKGKEQYCKEEKMTIHNEINNKLWENLIIYIPFTKFNI